MLALNYEVLHKLFRAYKIDNKYDLTLLHQVYTLI
jgi:hypothetical protein